MDPFEQDQLAELLRSLAETADADHDLHARLMTIVRLAVQVFPKCSGGSIALLIDGRPTTVYETDRVTLEVDLVKDALTIGTINLYSDQAEGFAVGDEPTALVFAAEASTLLAGSGLYRSAVEQRGTSGARRSRIRGGSSRRGGGLDGCTAARTAG